MYYKIVPSHSQTGLRRGFQIIHLMEAVTSVEHLGGSRRANAPPWSSIFHFGKFSPKNSPVSTTLLEVVIGEHKAVMCSFVASHIDVGSCIPGPSHSSPPATTQLSDLAPAKEYASQMLAGSGHAGSICGFRYSIHRLPWRHYRDFSYCHVQPRVSSYRSFPPQLATCLGMVFLVLPFAAKFPFLNAKRNRR